MSTSALRRRAAAVSATAVAVALALSACSAGSSAGPSASSAASDTDATLTLGLAAVPASLDFTTTGGAAIFQALVGNVYEGLVQLDQDGTVQPLLATDWTVSDDGLTYSFTLREGVTFHDGTPFDADIVKSSLERLPEWTANSPKFLGAIDHVDVVSPTQADVVLSRPDANLLFWMSTVLGVMMTPDSIASLATAANGTGPFTFGSYEQGVTMVLDRNDDYWGEKAGVAEVDLDYFADASAAANALRTGGVDALFQAEAYDQIASFEADPAYDVTVGTTQSVVVLSLNSSHEALSDLRVRQAISRAIDKDAVLAAATSGYGTELSGPSVPTDPWYEEFDENSYDPTSAKALLAEAGVSGLVVNFTVPNRPYAQAVAQVVQSNLAAVGITANLEVQEFPAVWVEKTLTNHEYDLTVVNHVEARNLVSYGDPTYYWSFDNAEVQTDFAAASTALTTADQTAAVKAAQEVIVAEAPGVWLYNTPNIVVAKAGVTGLPTNYLGVGIALAGATVSQ
ncbi:MAG: ABC transporter substrate-binding protein [Actinobacteria bacterium]|nr:ABC transporter substrate-binding protein [Actinomycetota bacterium]MBU4337107.1 ABC transporter substrate-binding protein [Actinomycetota bacterium]MCG2798503.1 ABC transporter substrate-binding protein [Cellulomonas sp.]